LHLRCNASPDKDHARILVSPHCLHATMCCSHV
jgi:hypothetical protein